MLRKTLITFFILVLVIIFIIIYPSNKDRKVMVASISSDGKYIITSSLNQHIVLWDIKRKSSKLITRHGNIYSAYFVKNTHNFIWQDENNNKVYVENISGKIVKTISPGFPTYGNVLTSGLQKYVASDKDWNLYLFMDGHKFKLMTDKAGFIGVGKLLNMSLSDSNKYLLTSGDGDLGHGITRNYTNKKAYRWAILWDLNNRDIAHGFGGNVAKMYATLSPDGKYVVSGDEGTWGFVWNALTGEKSMELWDIWYGKSVKYNSFGAVVGTDNTGLIPVPKDFISLAGTKRSYIVSMKFINNNHYLRFTTGTPYAILYSVNDPRPIKYLFLGKKPFPSVDAYLRDESIDTAPKAQILVTGQYKGNGIIVYKYDPKKQTLKRIWVGQPPGFWRSLFSSFF